jgi:hypothetical protein
MKKKTKVRARKVAGKGKSSRKTPMKDLNPKKTVKGGGGRGGIGGDVHGVL